MKYTESFEKLCGSCPHQNCCTNSQEPLVFGIDFEDLKKIGKANENYLKKITIKGMQVNAIKRKENSTNCIFWDDLGKKCSIYSQRPFDCRAYPFDILLVDGKYHWIVYTCNTDSDWEGGESYLQMLENDKAFSDIMRNIEIFAGNTERILPEESKKTPYKILREINFQK